jgi:hypothetical protein
MRYWWVNQNQTYRHEVEGTSKNELVRYLLVGGK